jgi:hypothetical protein
MCNKCDITKKLCYECSADWVVSKFTGLCVPTASVCDPLQLHPVLEECGSEVGVSDRVGELEWCLFK